MLAQKKETTYQPFSVCSTLEEVKRQRSITKTYFIKQKLMGLLVFAIGLFTILLLQDGTFSLVTVPLGLYLIFTQEKVMTFRRE